MPRSGSTITHHFSYPAPSRYARLPICWKLSIDNRRLHAVCEDTTGPRWGHVSTGVLLRPGRFRSYAHSHFQADVKFSDASIWCLWLASIIQALHCDVSFNSFSSRELWARMPASAYGFQDIYRTLLESNKDSALPLDLVSPNDAFVLLLAILSDCLCLQQSLGQIAGIAHTAMKQNMRNPFTPLSGHAELARMRNALSSALDRWHALFGVAMAPEILALFHYCRLYLTCFQLLELPRLAGYKLVSPSRSAAHGPSITSESVSQAWMVLDNAAARHEASSSQSLCPAWLPIIVFHAGLVLWARQKYGNDDENHAYGSTKILLPFRMELEQMTWPCCKGMAATLDRLMNDTSLGRV